MCGVAGILDPCRSTAGGELADAVGRMTAALAHRGPDGTGAWVDAAAGIALGHRRLAVLDLSPAGAQPMRSAGGRYVLTYNGELYDHDELRSELTRTGHRFRGTSDTEVLLAAIERWGLDRALVRSNGMFALALWDRQERTLHLARDRVGEKPLFYGWWQGRLLFGSELKALRSHPGFGPAIDIDAVAAFLRLGFVPSPGSIYQGVRKLGAGRILSVAADGSVQERAYWSLEDEVERALADPFLGSAAEATEVLDQLLGDAVRQRLAADVPLGAFLSGGIDSTVVTAIMQSRATAPVRTFTVAFSADTHDEASHARAIARHLGTDHTELELTPDDALAVIPRLPQLYDEPLADPSQLPTAAMAAAASRHVTVCLSGDGGDEVFGGYNRYTVAGAAWPRLARVPRGVRAAAAGLLGAPSHAAWSGAARRMTPFLPRALRVPAPADKLQKLIGLLPATSADDLYLRLLSIWDEPEGVVRGARPALPVTGAGVDLRDPVARMMLSDTLVELPDGMLVKVDRASMGVGLEIRVPLLDHRLVEFAWRLPPAFRARPGAGKWILRQVAARYVPPALTERPKAGFDPPLGAWLRGPLRGWAEDLLDPAELAADGLLDPEPIHHRWNEHQTGARNWEYALWAVLVFRSWQEDDRARPRSAPHHPVGDAGGSPPDPGAVEQLVGLGP